MATAVLAKTKTLADMLHELGDVPASRVRLVPYPATKDDVLAIHGKEKRRFELADGILVEKVMGFEESLLAVAIGVWLHEFVMPRRLGLVTGEAGMMELSSGLVRIPDVSFISWDQIPGRKVPKEPIPKLAPTLAVEVVSKGNTLAEIKRKLREYFKAGVLLVWIVDPKKRTIAVHTSPKNPTILNESQTLDGGEVLPGFKLPLRDLFAELDQEAPK
jgi:Uma2 family endonuclease